MTGVTGDTERGESVLAATSRAMVALHKEQFGRGPTRSRSHFAGDDTLVCVLHDALLPAERAMIEMGDQARVRETRVAFQAATRDRFVEAVEKIVERPVVAFASAIDPDHDVVWEVFNFKPSDPHTDGKMNTHPDTGRC
jgi:uncharacterized protein YbcI